MPYSINHIQDAVEIAWQGKFDYKESTSFKNMTHEICQQDIKLLVLNLSDCDYIDSAGLGLLMMAREMSMVKDIYFKITGAHHQVLRMLEVAQFGEIIDFEHCTREGVIDLLEQIAKA
ncbi:MAG: STAS domain-containing protein [Methylocystaceae bacterium]|nr:STAS domain-containing protein [Methylocystaceae bacterium]